MPSFFKSAINSIRSGISNAAKEYAHKRDMIFQVWTEDTIKGLGIKLIT